MTTVLQSLNSGLQNALSISPDVYLLGEDLLDPYGGAFKVTHGLSTAYPERVLTTPISEAGIVGLAAGMAMRGLRPVVEIMFGDFVTLAADALINHAAKFRWMYNEQVRVPLVVRTPMGGRRGYGPTHSQTLEKLFMGVPGLQVLAPTSFGDPAALLSQAILETEDPVLFVENKLLYLLPIKRTSPEFEVEEDQSGSMPDTDPLFPGQPFLSTPSYRLRLQGAPEPVLTLATYGYMAEIAHQAALHLAYQHELFVELVVLTQLAPFNIQPVINSACQTTRLMTIEEGSLSLGWGAEIQARCAEALGNCLVCVRRLAARDLPVPASGPLENAILPQVENIVQLALEMKGGAGSERSH